MSTGGGLGGDIGAVLRRTDPNVRRRPVFRAFAHVFATPPVGWMSRMVMWRLHPIVMRAVADRVFPGYAIYRQRAADVGRTTPILQLLPRS